jgi:hypothetical protein
LSRSFDAGERLSGIDVAGCVDGGRADAVGGALAEVPTSALVDIGAEDRGREACFLGRGASSGVAFVSAWLPVVAVAGSSPIEVL